MAIDSVFQIMGRQHAWPEFTHPAAKFEVVDQSTSTSQVGAAGQGDCGTGMRWFRAAIFQKGAVPSTIAAGQTAATGNAIYELQVSSVVGFTAGMVKTIGQGIIDRTTSSTGTCIIGPCLAPDNPVTTMNGYQFVRINLPNTLASAVSYDAIIEAC